MKNTNIVFIIFSIIGVLIIALLIGGGDPFNSQHTDEQSRSSEKKSFTMPDDWQQYTNPVFDFTFHYPPNAHIQHEAGSVKVQVVHPESNRGEITDGFTFYIRTHPIADTLTLKEFSQQKFVEETERLKALSKPRKRMYGDREAYQFSLRSELGGSVTHIQMRGNNNRLFIVSHIISGPQDRRYKETVKTIIKSAQIESDNETQGANK